MVPFTIDIAQNTGNVILQALDKYYFRARLYLVAAVVNIGITCVLAVQFGCIGAAVATGVTLFITSGIVMNWYYARKIGLDIGLFWRECLKFTIAPVALCAIGAIAWHFLSASVEVGWFVLVVGILVYTAVYAAVVIATANPYERSLMRNVLSRFTKHA